MADCIIVGGGLIGMLTARELRLAGADPMIIEKGALGGESTWAGGGILSPLYPWRYPDAVNVLARQSQAMYADLAEQLHRESGIDPEYTPSGLLVLDADQQAAATAWADQWAMQLDVLDQADLRRHEAQLNPDFDTGLLLPDIAQLRNPRLAKALRGSLDYHRIPYLENTPVTDLVIEQGKITGVCTPQQVFSADRVVIAGGAWSAEIVQQYARAPEIEPVKGQMILFRGQPGLLQHIVLYRDRYLIPRRDGRILAGSTLEHSAFDKRTTEQALNELRAAAIALVPELEALPIEHHWAGLRPGTATGIPYICEHPRLNGLYINSGHYRNGVVLGAASCRLLAEMVLKHESSIQPDAYALAAKH